MTHQSDNPYESPAPMPVPGRPAPATGPGWVEPYKDRSVGLAVFGVLLMVMGGLCALAVPLMIVGLVMAMMGPGAPPGFVLRTMVPGLMLYAIAAVVFIWVGFGSYQARRWARALILVLSWIWLVSGIGGMVFWAVFMPHFLNQMAGTRGMPPGGIVGMAIGMSVFMAVIYLILPGVFVLFYQSRHVKATCERRDPQERWTDRCPLPVLAVSVLMVFFLYGVLSSVATNFAIPFFGLILSGVAGAVVVIPLAAVLGSLAYATYKLKMSGWWGSVVLYGLWAVSYFVTFSGRSMLDYYEAMGLPVESIDLIKDQGMVQSSYMPWATAASTAALFAYLLFVRRYFVAAASAGPDATDDAAAPDRAEGTDDPATADDAQATDDSAG